MTLALLNNTTCRTANELLEERSHHRPRERDGAKPCREPRSRESASRTGNNEPTCLTGEPPMRLTLQPERVARASRAGTLLLWPAFLLTLILVLLLRRWL